MTATDSSIAWIGYGSLGRALVNRLRSVDKKVSIFDHDPRRREENLPMRMSWCASITQAIENADVVFSCLWDDASLDAVVEQISSARPTSGTRTLIDMTTVSIEASARAAERLARAGVGYLRAPVSGSTELAALGQSTIFVSGPSQLFERHLPMLQVLGGVQPRLGNGEEARAMKLVVNFALHATTLVVGEAIVLGESAGLARATVVQALAASAVRSPHLQGKALAWCTGKYQPALAPLEMAAKDIRFACRMANVEVRLPVLAQLDKAAQDLLRAGSSGEDVSILAEAPRLLQVP